jgi:hypothetical protein
MAGLGLTDADSFPQTDFLGSVMPWLSSFAVGGRGLGVWNGDERHGIHRWEKM